MLDTPKKRPPLPLPKVWARAIERIDQAIEQNSPLDYTDKLDLFGQIHFGDLWVPYALRKDSGPNQTNSNQNE